VIALCRKPVMDDLGDMLEESADDEGIEYDRNNIH